MSKRKFEYSCNDIENVENYELAKADNFKGWHCHHRFETHTSDGERRPNEAQITVAELQALGMYYNRPPEELIFLTIAQHTSIHFKGRKSPYKGITPSNETIQKKIDSAKTKKRVLCIETGIVYESLADAFRQTGISKFHISAVCNGRLKRTGGFHWSFI